LRRRRRNGVDDTRRGGGRRITLDDLGRQVVELFEQILLLLLVADAGDLGADLDQLVLGLLPVAAGDEVLHLVQLGPGGQPHLIVTHLFGRAEQHGAHAVQAVARAGPGHDGTESTDTQHSSRRRSDHAQTTRTPPRCGDGVGVPTVPT
jgi:hypothetical protein